MSGERKPLLSEKKRSQENWGTFTVASDTSNSHKDEEEPHRDGPVQRVHCHTERGEGPDKKLRYKLICSSLFCIIFIIIEVVGGVLSNSLAIATNALNLFTDLLNFIISLIAIWVEGLPTSQRMSWDPGLHGWGQGDLFLF